MKREHPSTGVEPRIVDGVFDDGVEIVVVVGLAVAEVEAPAKIMTLRQIVLPPRAETEETPVAEIVEEELLATGIVDDDEPAVDANFPRIEGCRDEKIDSNALSELSQTFGKSPRHGVSPLIRERVESIRIPK